ncbi:hypothetical protein CVV65_10400 [Kyrpidia spormannii]|uniref:PIG-L family deacetylase n=1 Tax=Kyrpidia spormannii TaxID=2055160 RepID=A0A2K8N7L1_9BACL|nr:PIG-L family deacetylase [Kyrpidia spormannii]ATY85283.1 hypothetical protein CVV65_10400 [Kyrpidia spormannii]
MALRLARARRWAMLAILGLVVLALFGFGFIWLTPYWIDLVRPAPMPPAVDERDFGDRVLYISPHPDDESLGGGGLIQRLVAQGKQVFVVFMTVGDGYRRAAEEAFHVFPARPADLRRLGALRHGEALAALGRLGVPAENVVFFGFPDGGLSPMWEAHWSDDDPVRGPNGATRVPYPFAYQSDRPYSGSAAVAELEAVLKQFQPTDVIYPDPFDQHPDHLATSAFVVYTLAKLQQDVREWTYLVHRGDYPVPWTYEPKWFLLPPGPLVAVGVHWLAFPLRGEEEAGKYAAISQHVSQVRTIGPFLRAFVRRNDLFGRIDTPVLRSVAGFDPMGAARSGAAAGAPREHTWSFIGSGGSGNRAEPAPLAPYTVVLDAVGDTLQREWEGSADLRAVASVRSGGRWYIGIQTRRRIDSAVSYELHLRLFQKVGVRRVDLAVRGGVPTVLPGSAPSDAIPPGVMIRGDVLWLSFPDAWLADTGSWMVEVQTRVAGHQVDSSPWRIIRLSPK